MRDFEKIRKIRIPWDVPIPDWELEYEQKERKLVFYNEEEEQRTKAMIEFCTNYEAELFKTFYKWFRKERKVE